MQVVKHVQRVQRSHLLDIEVGSVSRMPSVFFKPLAGGKEVQLTVHRPCIAPDLRFLPIDVFFFQPEQDFLGPRDNGVRDPGQTGDFNTVAVIGTAGFDVVQERRSYPVLQARQHGN